MERIAKFESRSEAEERAAFLRSRGIAAHVTDMTSLRLNLAHQGRFRAALWAILPHQYEDAAALLADPEHQVEAPLSAEALARLEDQGGERARRAMLRGLLVIAVVLSALVALVVRFGG
ncbi:MAG: hypothetical protein HND55_12360 [Pseudomonadota bacterium]|nr:MAG: hypothetical protein HND55_12360 [Pseudomonadota bacterium]